MEDYPDFFYEWDGALSGKQNFPFLDSDEFYETIEIYLSEGKFKKARKTIQYTLSYYSDNNDLICDILSLLNDFECWNDLLLLSDRYQNEMGILSNGYKIKALLYLGMEEEAIVFFEKMKYKYEKELTNLSFIYKVMSENLVELDLFRSAADIIKEGICLFTPTIDFYWLQLQCFLFLKQKEKALGIINKILKINSSNGEIWHKIGKIYFNLDELGKAVEAFELAESLGYCIQINYLYLIIAYQSNGQEIKALDKIKDYLKLFPKHYTINILAALICSIQEKWKEGLIYIDAALTVVPNMHSLYLYKSHFFLHLGDRQKAISVLKEGIKVTKDIDGKLKKELEKLQNRYPNY